MSALPELAVYLAKLRELGAPVIDNLRPGFSLTDLADFEAKLGLDLPEQLADYWREIGGIAAPSKVHLDGLVGPTYAPLSLNDALADYGLLAEVRESNPADDKEFAATFWPSGFVKFAGEDANGYFVNCRAGSPTFGAVYLRGVNTDSLKRWANSLRALFSTLLEGLNSGSLFIAGTSDAMWDEGALAENFELFRALAKRMNPDCPAHDELEYDNFLVDW